MKKNATQPARQKLKGSEDPSLTTNEIKQTLSCNC